MFKKQKQNKNTIFFIIIGASLAEMRRRNQEGKKKKKFSLVTRSQVKREESGWAERRDGAASRGLQSSVLHPVLVDGEIVQHLGHAAGGAGQETLLLLAHQPPAGAGRHVAGDVLAGPGVEPGVEAPVQPGVDPLVRLEEIREKGPV